MIEAVLGSVAAVCLVGFTVWLIFRKPKFPEHTVPMSGYLGAKGKFRDSILKAERWVRAKLPKLDFDIYVYTGPSEDVDSRAGFPFMRKPYMVLNERHLENNGWRRDFNRIADEWGIRRLGTLDENAQFLFFHEHRHIQQAKIKGLKRHSLEMTDERIKQAEESHVWRYRYQPHESDADHFGLTSVAKLHGA